MKVSVFNERDGRLLSLYELTDALLNSLDASWQYFHPESDEKVPSKIAAALQRGKNSQSDASAELGISWVGDSVLLARDGKPDIEITGVEKIICFYGAWVCAQARELFASGNAEAAWATLVSVSQSATALSVAIQLDTAFKENGYAPIGETKSLLARIAADARHAENRTMKAEVFSWLDANMANFKSMDKAAEAIAGKIAPIAFRTAREWVGEWKKPRSPGTP